MEIKNANWYLIKKEVQGIPLSSLTKKLIEQQIPIKVYNSNVYNDGRVIFCINNLKEFSNAGTFILYKQNLEPIEEKDALKKIEKENKKFIKDFNKQVDNLKEKRKSIDKKRISDYLLASKNSFKSTCSFVKKDIKNILTIKSTEEEKNSPNVFKNFLVECCSFTRCSNNLLVYIPKTWLTYYGYNILDLKSYISFLKKCDINFEADILGVVDLHKSFNCAPIVRKLRKDNHFIKENEIAYEILLKGKTSSYNTYINFLLLRYIVNSQYWNIPLIAMKLKKNMPKATHWQCLLLAHNAEAYNSYYSLSTTDYQKVLFQGNISLINNPQDVLKAASVNSSVNRAFTLRNVTHRGQSIRNLVLNENYELLQEFLNEN